MFFYFIFLVKYNCLLWRITDLFLFFRWLFRRGRRIGRAPNRTRRRLGSRRRRRRFGGERVDGGCEWVVVFGRFWRRGGFRGWRRGRTRTQWRWESEWIVVCSMRPNCSLFSSLVLASEIGFRLAVVTVTTSCLLLMAFCCNGEWCMWWWIWKFEIDGSIKRGVVVDGLAKQEGLVGVVMLMLMNLKCTIFLQHFQVTFHSAFFRYITFHFPIPSSLKPCDTTIIPCYYYLIWF